MEWLKASRVFEMAGERPSVLSAHSRLAKAICKRAKAGMLKSRADRYILAGDPPRDDVELPSDFWWAEGDLALTQDWQSGDFSTCLRRGQFDKGRTADAFGVSFAATEVAPIIKAHARRPLTPPDTPFCVASPRKGTGGAKKDQAAWDSFWMAVVELAMQERLNIRQFPGQPELRAEILEMINDALKDRTIKPVVSQIWNRWIEPTR